MQESEQKTDTPSGGGDQPENTADRPAADPQLAGARKPKWHPSLRQKPDGPRAIYDENVPPDAVPDALREEKKLGGSEP